MNQFISIITARGGSKGVLNKNIHPLNGKPLIAYSIEAALNAKFCSSCFVTTDDPKIAEVATRYGASVISRPPELSNDDSKSEDAVLHAIDQITTQVTISEWCALLQPTSPLRTSSDLDSCFELTQSQNANAIISVCESKSSPYKMLNISNGNLKPLFNKDFLSTPRQKLPVAYQQNGAIYMFRTRELLSQKTFFLEPVLAYKMPLTSSIDIDTLEDFELCEKAMK